MSEFDSRKEIEKAQSRIDQIRKSRGTGQQQPARQEPVQQEPQFQEPAYQEPAYEEEGLGAIDSDVLSRARSRSSVMTDEFNEEQEPVKSTGRRQSRTNGSNAMRFILMLVGIAIAIVIVLFLVSSFFNPGNEPILPFSIFGTDTPTPTATYTPTPLPTETPLPTATPLPPDLSLPPLTCIFQSGVGCFDYCSAAENADECQAAKDFVAAQGADGDYWLTCLAAGPGPNTGNPQQCLVEAYFAEQDNQ